MSTPDQPQLEPVRNDGIRAIQVGLGLWAVAGLLLLLRRRRARGPGHAMVAGRLWGGAADRRRHLGHLRQARSLIRARERDVRPTSPRGADRRGADRLSMGAVFGRVLLASGSRRPGRGRGGARWAGAGCPAGDRRLDGPSGGPRHRRQRALHVRHRGARRGQWHRPVAPARGHPLDDQRLRRRSLPLRPGHHRLLDPGHAHPPRHPGARPRGPGDRARRRRATT